MSTSLNAKISLNDFQLRDGIYFPNDYEQLNSTEQKQRWDEIGKTYYGSQKIEQAEETSPLKQDYTLLTGRPGGTWNKFPINKSVDSILEIGCGYGRIPLFLSKDKNLRCQKYYGIDISESLLRRLLKCKQEYDFFPGAEFYIICASAELLPLEDNSVDLIISNCVFMHIPEAQIRNLLVEVSRVLKPGGTFVFNHSFHNKSCPSHIIHNLVRRLNPKQNSVYLKQYSSAEINAMLTTSGMKTKCPQYIVEPTQEYAILPETIKGIQIPFANSINRSLKPSAAMKETLAYGYSAYSSQL
ncbi:MAG: methyltransferase domain-containing protein [Brasilonema octagenarum HA4186-MV1]|jgi:ubiquinone/menaquinone biosynthesis C-methylase UbiE|uniref:Class I SAM-dependent methyltransferase n=2 Tax=Brasilonema TaxID=383614 RepID=A0A856MHR0_9CYAN|nr:MULTISPECIES: class I SAM-dependent methyltransferase [Brasilonema]MBW4624033.1 methyltransferase domain-containing protein [Brasilonema octagenarum HA4186-MV1]NMF66952.1 class I SAM-dependent methyltransferase [Brasilonema octagenarum UFV-OR1]QDL09789.1 class I SAM-dependent methyltransferase [Brasilonema sennae CENA114]QDL16142.1 class I SAM-dependent methyltransferase [Brasilonema octagenarum UFV-E1]